MKIDLKKLPRDRKDFSVEYKEDNDTLLFTGCIFSKVPFLIVEGKIEGKVEVVCDLSGEKFFDKLNDEIKIKVIDGSYSGFDETYDIIEIEDGVFDLESFLAGEIELFRNDYHKKEIDFEAK